MEKASQRSLTHTGIQSKRHMLKSFFIAVGLKKNPKKPEVEMIKSGLVAGEQGCHDLVNMQIMP